MKTLIIYDSKFGNTKVVAHTIMKALPSSLTKILSVNKTSISSLKSFSLLIVAQSLKNKGGKLIAPPEGFIVTSKDGPLKKGEIERVSKWTKKLISLNQ